MSKQFERLYHAWVLEFRERYLRWVDPKARPWESTCRVCDGKCVPSDEKMVLCDHCDAMNNLQCLSPPLKQLPRGVWHCPDCAPKVAQNRGLPSAASEQAAKRRADLGEIPKKKVTVKKFLVKWAGLGYEHCSWETREDVNDDDLIEDFYALNNTTPEEPMLLDNDVQATLATAKHLHKDNVGGTNDIPDLRCMLYSQVRAIQFTRFGRIVPEKLAKECGRTMSAMGALMARHSDIAKPCLSRALERKAHDTYLAGKADLAVAGSPPPAILWGEYDVTVPITSRGLMLNVGEVEGCVAFLGYRQFPDNSKGPAEVQNLIKNVGDIIIAVDGVSTVSYYSYLIFCLFKEWW